MYNKSRKGYGQYFSSLFPLRRKKRWNSLLRLPGPQRTMTRTAVRSMERTVLRLVMLPAWRKTGFRGIVRP